MDLSTAPDAILYAANVQMYMTKVGNLFNAEIFMSCRRHKFQIFKIPGTAVNDFKTVL